jgi:hypothetical protein
MTTGPATLPTHSPAVNDSLLLAAANDSMAVEAVYGSYSELAAPAKKPLDSITKTAPAGLFDGFLSVGVIFLFLLLFRYVRQFFSALMGGLFNFHAAEKKFHENSLSFAITSRALLAFSFISIGFFAWLALLRTGFVALSAVAPWEYFGIITGVCALFFIVKTALLRIVEFIGKTTPVMQLIIFFSRLHSIACGFILLPIVLLLVTAGMGMLFKSLVVAGLLVILFFAALHILRIIRIFLMARISVFFLILYLCTFEIAPFLLLYSFIILDYT